MLRKKNPSQLHNIKRFNDRIHGSHTETEVDLVKCTKSQWLAQIMRNDNENTTTTMMTKTVVVAAASAATTTVLAATVLATTTSATMLLCASREFCAPITILHTLHKSINQSTCSTFIVCISIAVHPQIILFESLSFINCVRIYL